VTTLTLVLDYAAMGKPEKRPQRRHRDDCPHPYQEPPHGPPIWRNATAAEMQSLPPCRDCLAKETP
jgi:hypothetical protein